MLDFLADLTEPLILWMPEDLQPLAFIGIMIAMIAIPLYIIYALLNAVLEGRDWKKEEHFLHQSAKLYFPSVAHTTVASRSIT